ncbi:uncharacterized protein M6B38_389005 [Iris pallida]|uniref:Uncharacterized protein n=1 Tax=Iris pallida TaxID=29817 RepID=A0AAX6G1G2_IRIPA|nr:uncharacterized protein M6B38_389005 [Iris pallida]
MCIHMIPHFEPRRQMVPEHIYELTLVSFGGITENFWASVNTVWSESRILKLLLSTVLRVLLKGNFVLVNAKEMF